MVSEKENREFGIGFFLFLLAFFLAIINLLVGSFLIAMILLMLGIFGFVTLALWSEFFPETKKRPRRTGQIPSMREINTRVSRKIYGAIIGVSILFLGILWGTVWWGLIQADDAIILAVFTIIFQAILCLITEVRRR